MNSKTDQEHPRCTSNKKYDNSTFQKLKAIQACSQVPIWLEWNASELITYQQGKSEMISKYKSEKEIYAWNELPRIITAADVVAPSQFDSFAVRPYRMEYTRSTTSEPT